MEQPLVSVIVPMYNAQNTIRRCVESICGQSYPNLEILLLNDGSKDDTLAVCRELAAADARIRLIDKPNSGASDTRNQGLALARGEYIQFADSDDYLLPGCTERLVSAARRHKAVLVLAPYRMMIPHGSGYDTREYSLLPAGVYTKADYLWWVIGQPASFYFTVVWNKLFRRDVIAAHGVRFPAMAFTEDQQFNAAYLHHTEGAFVSLAQPCYCYVQNPQSICHTQINLASIVQNKLQVFRYYKELYTKLGLYDQVQPQLYKFLTAFSENAYPSGSPQKIIMDMANRWGFGVLDASDKEKKHKTEPDA